MYGESARTVAALMGVGLAHSPVEGLDIVRLASRRIIWEPLIVAHVGTLTNAPEGLPRAYLTSVELLHATANNEGLSVL